MSFTVCNRCGGTTCLGWCDIEQPAPPRPSGEQEARAWFIAQTDIPRGLYGMTNINALYFVLAAYAAHIRQQCEIEWTNQFPADAMQAAERIAKECLGQVAETAQPMLLAHKAANIIQQLAAHLRQQQREQDAQIAERLYTKINGIGIAEAIRSQE